YDRQPRGENAGAQGAGHEASSEPGRLPGQREERDDKDGAARFPDERLPRPVWSAHTRPIVGHREGAHEAGRGDKDGHANVVRAGRYAPPARHSLSAARPGIPPFIPPDRPSVPRRLDLIFCCLLHGRLKSLFVTQEVIVMTVVATRWLYAI